MAAAPKKVPLGRPPAQKRAATPRIGPLEKAAATAVAAATKAKTLTSPWDIVTAEILKATAKAADKAQKDDDRAEFKALVDKMREVLAELDPRGGVSDDRDSGISDMDRELAGILGSGPEIRDT